MKPEIGLVPPDIKIILDKLKLSATTWLGDFSDEDIEELEKSVRVLGQKVDLEERNTFMEEYSACPETFRFNFVQKKCLRRISQAIRDRGIAFFIDQKIPTSNASLHPENVDFYDDASERSALILKLVDSEWARYKLECRNVLRLN